MSFSNVTVLTSSTSDKPSREDDAWMHGAFTKVLLNALSGTAVGLNTDHGVISMSGLTDYLGRNLKQLTGGQQQLGLDQKFLGGVFFAGF